MQGTGFLQPQTLDALGAQQFSYPKEFTISAATNGAPSSVGSGPISIQKPFFAESVGITFPTTILSGGNVIDDGVCRLTLLLKKNSTLSLFDAAMNLALIAVPGRQTVAGALNLSGGTPEFGQAPHIAGYPFKVFLDAGSQFQHQFSNASDVAAVVNVMYWGYELAENVVIDGETVPMNEINFWKTVRLNQPKMRAF